MKTYQLMLFFLGGGSLSENKVRLLHYNFMDLKNVNFKGQEAMVIK